MAEESCIWCRRTPANSLEHIAPEALGCPAEFVLRSGVCRDCNNKNGKLDRALLTPFEIITVMKGIPRKRGKRPTVDGYSSMASDYDENGPAFYMNREKHSVYAPSGRVLKGTNANDPIRNFRWERFPDDSVKLSYEQELRLDRKAVRGLFKIAVGSIAFFEGLEAARCQSLDGVKHFVKDGGGNFRAILVPDPSPTHESFYAPCYKTDDGHRAFGMALLGVGFICDFDPDFTLGSEILKEYRISDKAAQVIPNYPIDIWEKNNKILQIAISYN